MRARWPKLLISRDASAANVPLCRYEDPGDAAPGHATDAGERSPPLLLCLFHLRHCGGPAVGRTAAQPLLPGRGHKNVSNSGPLCRLNMICLVF